MTGKLGGGNTRGQQKRNIELVASIARPWYSSRPRGYSPSLSSMAEMAVAAANSSARRFCLRTIDRRNADYHFKISIFHCCREGSGSSVRNAPTSCRAANWQLIGYGF